MDLEAEIKNRKIEVRTADSLESAVAHCMALRMTGYWSFRGQRRHEWFAEPHTGATSLLHLHGTLENFKARCMEFPRPDYIEDTENPRIREWRWLFYAQHHRLRTPLLDWTSNPLVAVYFAVEDILSKAPRGAYGAVWALHANAAGTLHWENRLGEQNPYDTMDWLLIRPPVVTHRIARQSGLFTIHPNRQLLGTEKFCQSDDQKRIVKIQIVRSRSGKNPSTEIRRRLGFMNIHHASLFPHPEGVAHFLNEELPALRPAAPRKASTP